MLRFQYGRLLSHLILSSITNVETTSPSDLFIESVMIARLPSLLDSLTDVSHPASAHRHRGGLFLITESSRTSFNSN